jgi:hypothetical protein
VIPRRIAVVGTLASDPDAGMAWMLMQIVVGLLRLHHDAYYFETTSSWPYDPIQARSMVESYSWRLVDAEPFTTEGLFAFKTKEVILAAFETIRSDYDRHSRAARAIAEEHFRAETVLTKLFPNLGV